MIKMLKAEQKKRSNKSKLIELQPSCKKFKRLTVMLLVSIATLYYSSHSSIYQTTRPETCGYPELFLYLMHCCLSGGT